MSSILSNPGNGDPIAPGQTVTREWLDTIFARFHQRLATLELTEADYEAAIDAITTQALAIVSANITAEVEDQRVVLAQIQEAAEQVLADIALIQGNGVLAASLVTLTPIAGFAPTRVQDAIAALVAREPLALLAASVTVPAAGSTPVPSGGSLALAAAPVLSLYGKAQKTIRFQIASAATFAANKIVYDTGVLTQSATTASVPNAQSLFAGGATYYVRAVQTDVDGASTDWSPTVAFTYPKVPNAAAMSAPADGATNVAAQSQPLTLTAAAYSHPNGLAQAARRFEVSSNNFANVITINGVVGQNTATIASPKDVLTANTAYKVRCVDTDSNGGVVLGAPSSFTTAVVFKPSIGQAYEGGFLAFEKFGDGLLYDLIVAPKSAQASGKTWSINTSAAYGAYSRLNGPGNDAKAAETNTASAFGYSRSVTLNGAAAYLPAIDEWNAIVSKLKPSAAPTAAFQSGGSEVFTATAQWSSTEVSAVNGLYEDQAAGGEASAAKTNTYTVRPVKRLAVSLPYAIGTAMEGGYLAAYLTDCSSGSPVTYMLIVADKAAESDAQWSAAGLTPDASANGRTNGSAWPGGAQYPALTTCSDLTYNGKNDWYLGQIDEVLPAIRNNSLLPTAQRFDAVVYWTGTTVDSNNARAVNADGTENATRSKTSYSRVRPMRRVLLPA